MSTYETLLMLNRPLEEWGRRYNDVLPMKAKPTREKHESVYDYLYRIGAEARESAISSLAMKIDGEQQ